MKQKKGERMNINDSNANKSRLSYLKSRTNLSKKKEHEDFDYQSNGSIEDENCVEMPLHSERNFTVRASILDANREMISRNQELTTLREEHRAGLSSYIKSRGSK
jgi:hypothetical protein